MADRRAQPERVHVRSGASHDHHGGNGPDGNEEVPGIPRRQGRRYILSRWFDSQRLCDQLRQVFRFPRGQGMLNISQGYYYIIIQLCIVKTTIQHTASYYIIRLR